MSTHEELCERARRWLSGTRRCEPVFSNIASCAEIPDAIGWSSKWSWRGSTVIECKTSRSDFVADRKKYQRYLPPDGDFPYLVDRISKQFADDHRYKLIEVARMGDHRFFMSVPGIVTNEMVEEYAPDHGLLWVDGRSVRMIRNAPRRKSELIDKDGEIRYLRFAIINAKKPFIFDDSEQRLMSSVVETAMEVRP